ncbi:hypothetical protein [Kineosporia babensis]|uniref:Helix-turn-helix domain-containing protein n=1 Tax=Kineosporia babensis TaxID=499548 RepID=A0A9X1SXT5_9ACTN|nr:hypothetical protein [Kineosporia babensis]MCD5316164.1 hypothetical protein [Kineosporia babensis]
MSRDGMVMGAASVQSQWLAQDSVGGERESGSRVWTVESVRALGVTTDLATAASVLGFGRTLAFDLLRKSEFPVPVLRAGRKIRVPVQGLLACLGADVPTLTGDDVPADRGAVSSPRDARPRTGAA